MSEASRARRRVDFVIGGAQKGGTTLLASILARHPGVAMPENKEAHWFDRDERYAQGAPDVAPYHARFGDPSEPRLWGDATPSYVWWPPAPGRIREYSPSMRWILLLRDPASRAYSHWNMERTRGAETLGFREALAVEFERMKAATDTRRMRMHSYLSRGFYALQLERLRTHFPPEQTLLLRSEWLRDDAAGTVGRVLAFLGLAPIDLPRDVATFTGRYERPLDPADRAALVRVYTPDIRKLERMTGWDLADWLDVG